MKLHQTILRYIGMAIGFSCLSLLLLGVIILQAIFRPRRQEHQE